MNEQQFISFLMWVSGGAVAVIIALIGVIYSAHTREINKLREWRHNTADPAIRFTGYLEQRVEALEERL